MQRIEIRINKKKMYLMLSALAITLIATIYLVYFTKKFDGQHYMKIFYACLSSYLAYTIYTYRNKLSKNKPVLIITDLDITFNDKRKPESIFWTDVIRWRIEGDGGTNAYLIIDTADKKRKINLSWLEKRPAEMEALLAAYKAPDKAFAA